MTYAPLLKQVLRVIEKYDSRSQKINLYADFGEKTTFNRIAVMIFLLRDYYDYGLYSDSREVIEENGRGEILWDKTINNTYAVLNDDEPCYPYLYTRHHILDEQNFFRRLHACVLSRISREMEEAGLLELFDITEIPQAEEELEDLGDEDYLIYRLEQELDVPEDVYQVERDIPQLLHLGRVYLFVIDDLFAHLDVAFHVRLVFLAYE